MQKVDKQEYKKQVIALLEKVKKPIWISDLHKNGLAYCTLYGSKKNPASQALREMIDDNQITVLAPRYYKISSQRPRRKIALPHWNPIAKNARTYFEVQLVERIEYLERVIDKVKKEFGIHL